MPWDDTPAWERDAAAAVYDQVRAFTQRTGSATAKLSRAQKSRFVAVGWIGQIYKRIPDPKPSYIANWYDLPTWQQGTDADIFRTIERDL